MHEKKFLQEPAAKEVRHNEEQNETSQLWPERLVKPRFTIKPGTVVPGHLKKKVVTDLSGHMLGISLGNARMEEDKLEATVRWISENLTSCALVVGDSIYRHTLRAKKNLSPEEAKQKALQVGREFISRYGPMINKYRKKCDFKWMPMSEIEKHADFEQYLHIYQRLYAEDPAFRADIQGASKKYLGGAFNLGLLPENEQKEKLNITTNYFIEESALFTCLCQENITVLMYPGTIKPLQGIARGNVKQCPKPAQKLILVSLNLRFNGWSVKREASKDAPVRTAPRQSLSFLNKLKKNGWERLQSYTIKKKYRSGDIIVFNGMKNADLHILTKGTAEVLSGNIETERLSHKRYIGAPAFISEQNLLGGPPRTTSIAAFTDCETLLLPGDAFRKMLRRDPKMAAYLLFDIGRVLSMALSNKRNRQPTPSGNGNIKPSNSGTGKRSEYIDKNSTLATE